eukprot:jgi/Botrbrau1/5515/Bobra.0023s0003.2
MIHLTGSVMQQRHGRSESRGHIDSSGVFSVSSDQILAVSSLSPHEPLTCMRSKNEPTAQTVCNEFAKIPPLCNKAKHHMVLRFLQYVGRATSVPSVSDILVVTTATFDVDGAGVRLKDGSELSGDLVVDASGRGSKLRDWLGEAGVKGLVPPEIVDSGLQYSSRNYRLPANWPKEKLCLLSRSKGDGRHCIVLPMEHEQWQVILAGRKPHLPPADEEGFLQWIKDLPTSDTYDALTAATPTSPVFVYTSTQNIHRHLENVEMPDGLVAVGDAACSFNPIYGQGMTAAVQGADLLAQSIGSRLEAAQTSSSTTSRQEILKGLSQEFQTKLTATVEFPWKVATGNDIK